MPCQPETPLLASWYKQEHGRIALVGLDENDTTAKALAFAHAKGVTYPLGSDPLTTVTGPYGVDALPQTFFLNANHRIVEHVLGAMTKADLAQGVALMNAPGRRARRPSSRHDDPDADRAAVRAAAALRLGHQAHAAVGVRRARADGRRPGSWSPCRSGHRQSQQASDLRGYFGDVTTGVGSCAAALRDSMTSYQAVAGGDTAELGTARSIVGYGASNCEVASNESLSDFANYQVTESLDSLRLTAADNDVISWAFDATRYQQDMLAALAAAEHARRPGQGGSGARPGSGRR